MKTITEREKANNHNMLLHDDIQFQNAHEYLIHFYKKWGFEPILKSDLLGKIQLCNFSSTDLELSKKPYELASIEYIYAPVYAEPCKYCDYLKTNIKSLMESEEFLHMSIFCSYHYDLVRFGDLSILDACAKCSKCTESVKCSFCAEYFHRGCERHLDWCIM